MRPEDAGPRGSRASGRSTPPPLHQYLEQRKPAEDDAARVDRLYRLAFGRSPTSEEASRALAYLGESEAVRPDPKAKQPPDATTLRAERWVSFCQAIFASGEFRFLR